MRYPKKAYSREKRKDQIVRQFNVWHGNGDDEPKTMTRIARALNMSPSTTFQEILDEMVMEGKMTMEKRDKSGRWTGNYYLVIKTLITEKYAKRRVVIKQRGVLLATVENPFTQKELWS